MKTKIQRLSPTLEAYLEHIRSLQEKYGAVRVTDLAERMGCRMPSATSALRRLSRLELIHYEAYRPVTLTENGEAVVRRMNNRHRILADFLENILAFSEKVADSEACRLEHKISPKILQRLANFLRFLRSQEHAETSMLKQRKQFENYLSAKAELKKS